MRAVASLLTVTIVFAGCFPNNPGARTVAKYSEGGSILAGIAVLAIANSGADCDARGMPGVPDSNCKSSSGTASTVGLSLIIIGLVGFIATVSTTPDDKHATATVTVPPPPPKSDSLPPRGPPPTAQPAVPVPAT